MEAAESRDEILLVEDEAIIALAERQGLSRLGYTVVHASSGEAAVTEAVRNGRVSLVLMDIDLGEGMDGPEAARRILAARDLPIIFLSGHSENEMVDKVRAVTRYGYVTKNSGFTILQSTIEMAYDLFNTKARLKSANRHLGILSSINRALVRSTTQASILDTACRLAVDRGGFILAFADLYPSGGGGISTAAQASSAIAGDAIHAGIELLYREGRGPLAELERRGERHFSADTFAGLDQAALERVGLLDLGCRICAIALPLFVEGRLIGALCLAAREPQNLFGVDEVSILDEIAMDVSFSLSTIAMDANRKLNLSALRKSEAAMRRAEKLAAMGNWEMEANGELWLSRGARDILGLEEERVTEGAIDDLLFPEDRAARGKAMEALLGELRPYDICYRIRRKDDGSVRLIHARGEWDSAQEKAFGVVSDISQNF